MKKIFLSLSVLVLFFLSACEMGPTKDEAIDFNDEIVADYRDLVDTDDAFIDAMYEDDIYVIEEAMYDLHDVVDDLTDKYEDMEPFDEEDIFRTAFLNLLDVYDEVAYEDYPILIEYMWELEEGNYDIGDSYTDFAGEIDDKVADAKDEFYDKQKDFADQYDFRLE